MAEDLNEGMMVDVEVEGGCTHPRHRRNEWWFLHRNCLWELETGLAKNERSRGKVENDFFRTEKKWLYVRI